MLCANENHFINGAVIRPTTASRSARRAAGAAALSLLDPRARRAGREATTVPVLPALAQRADAGLQPEDGARPGHSTPPGGGAGRRRRAAPAGASSSRQRFARGATSTTRTACWRCGPRPGGAARGADAAQAADRASSCAPTAERLYWFADTSSVRAFLDRARARAAEPPLALRLPRAPGEREPRWTHLLCGAVDVIGWRRRDAAPTRSSPGEIGALKARQEAAAECRRAACAGQVTPMPSSASPALN